MTLYLYIRELWRREQDRHPTKSITFDMMAGACAYLADETAHHILVSSISGRDQSFDKRFATNSLTKGLVRTSYSRRNEWGKKVSRLILRPFIFFQFAFSTVYQIFRIVSFIQLKYTIGRSDVNLRSYLTQDWPDAEFWKAFPDYYYALPYWPRVLDT